MKKVLFVMAFTTLFAAGCQISDLAPDFKKERKVFTGIIADDATRTALVSDGDAYHVTWALGDRIMINGECEFTATVGDVTSTYFVQDTTGDRPDEPPTGPYKAVYPYTVGRGMPGVQNYAGNNVEILPMYAESNDETLAFKNMVGILKLNIRTNETGIFVKKIVITADQPMSGEYTVENSAAVITSGTAGVTLNCSKGVAISNDPVPVPFLVTVPANTYTGMTIKVYTTDGKVASLKMKSGASVKVERSKVYEAEFPINNFTPVEGVGGVALLPAGPDFNAAIKQLVLEDELAMASTPDEKCVTRIVFNTLCTDTEGLEIQDVTSEKPVYLVYDKASGVVSINTPAETLKLPADGSYTFANFGSLKYIDNLRCLNTEDVELMNHMFFCLNCSNRELRELDLSNFNTSNVTNMRSMFNACRNIRSLDLSSFNTQNVETMAYMFQYCVNLKDVNLKSFNTEFVNDMQYMFAYCYELESVDLSSFNTENCLTLYSMFRICRKLASVNLTSFNTENCTNFSNFFRECESLVSVDISNFDFGSAKDIRSFFYQCYSLQVADVSNFECEHITSGANCGYFFYRATSLREIYCGNTFKFGVDGGKTSRLACEPGDPYEKRPGSIPGSITIFCDEDIATWFTETGFRWLNNGHNADPIPITFKHYKTGNVISVVWPAS